MFANSLMHAAQATAGLPDSTRPRAPYYVAAFSQGGYRKSSFLACDSREAAVWWAKSLRDVPVNCHIVIEGQNGSWIQLSKHWVPNSMTEQYWTRTVSLQ